MRKILILADSSEKIGRGHQSRAEAMSSGFLSADVVLGQGDWHTKNIDTKKYFALIVDSYLMDEECEKFLRSSFDRFCVIDDYNRKKYSADLIINPNIYAQELDYSNQTAPVLGGRDYVALRAYFTKNKKSKHVDGNDLLVVNVRGAKLDYKKILSKISPMFKEVVCITNGDDFDNVRFCSDLDEKQIFELFSKASVAITSAGVSMNELAFIGTPFVCIQTAKNQELNIQAFHKAGAISHVLTPNDEDLENKIHAQIIALGDIELRKKTSLILQTLIHPHGVKNIAKAVLDL